MLPWGGELTHLVQYKEITAAIEHVGILWLGLLGNLAIDAGRSRVHGYQLTVT